MSRCTGCSTPLKFHPTKNVAFPIVGTPTHEPLYQHSVNCTQKSGKRKAMVPRSTLVHTDPRTMTQILMLPRSHPKTWRVKDFSFVPPKGLCSAVTPYCTIRRETEAPFCDYFCSDFWHGGWLD
ncbi:hypothetical protein BD289DRAFT_107150 [Coniella lustricola]|uniref:Uncharacterized protein n=1 Tax=Coniella lustricola TaxID=2025994 RepID=A0A2T3AGF8_9PEZI|nr:hypothetical protein BD289DRAFT_107150 [Coniella lustricola]